MCSELTTLNLVGLVSTEDMVVMMDEMGNETGIDVDRLLEIGKMNEKIVGRTLRSESIKNGRIPKELSQGLNKRNLNEMAS